MEDNTIIIDLNNITDNNIILIDDGTFINEEIDDNLTPLNDICNVPLKGALPDGGGSINRDHNTLNNLQGGSQAERYHLARTYYEAILAGRAPSSVNPFVTISELNTRVLPSIKIWSSEEAATGLYDVNTFVSHNGKIWRSLVLNNNVEPTLSATGTWEIQSFEPGGVIEEDVISTVTEGGINIGDTIEQGSSLTDFIKKFLRKVINPDITAPTFELINNAGFMEVGRTIPFVLQFNFNRGIIYQSWNNTSLPRAGAAISYNINGISNNTNTRTVSDYINVFGNNTFVGTVSYAQGVQPVDNMNANYQSPLAAGTSPSQSTTFQGDYPVFWYKSNSPITAASMVTAISNGSATKLDINASGTITIPFAATGEYLAVAYYSGYTTKTQWYVNTLDNGAIPGGVFSTATTLAVNSPQSYWNSVNFKIHVSPGLITQATPIQLRN